MVCLYLRMVRLYSRMISLRSQTVQHVWYGTLHERERLEAHNMPTLQGGAHAKATRHSMVGTAPSHRVSAARDAVEREVK